MKILLIDVYSSFLDFALRAQEYGHEVRWFQGKDKDGNASMVGDGLVKKVSDYHAHMKWADLILLSDNVKYIYHLEKYRREGYPIFGPSIATTEWELDRQKGQDLFKAAGLKIMESTTFKSLKEAKAFVMKNPKRWVSKPNADDNKALSYVSKSAADMVFMLDYWQKHSTLKTEFILQEFVPGTEVAVGGWFGANGFSKWFCENFEHKKLMNDDVGVNTGEMGTVLKYTQNSTLAEKLLRPLEGELYRKGYTGFIDVAVMVSKSGDPLPLEFTCRPGWPLFQIQQALHKGDPAEWMLDLIDGHDTLKVDERIATGVVMTIPDFPYSKLTQKEVSGYPVYNWEKLPAMDFHPGEIQSGEIPLDKSGSVCYTDGYVTAGDYVCVITGRGETVQKSKEAAYTNLKKIEIPNSPMYRTDIGCRLETALPILKEHGFCKDWRW